MELVGSALGLVLMLGFLIAIGIGFVGVVAELATPETGGAQKHEGRP